MAVLRTAADCSTRDCPSPGIFPRIFDALNYSQVLCIGTICDRGVACFSSQGMRLGCRLFTSVLMMPYFVNVFRTLTCTGTWLHTGWGCFTSIPHLAVVFISVLAAVASLPLMLNRT